ncbi:hypothetical protein BBF96_03275 [Anoxybacter fermentans]|uniref:Uncharacterized protein n=1 Tax=Anoxybacter fermentans TaxID=1323375 RepID=A0A3S9SVZ7_9FIRM|nr:phage holin family protein [Anoxybacter fermentans]AZR72486.1 hypothetical protein BBF96_03275 [Anoxybacter fermentans]
MNKNVDYLQDYYSFLGCAKEIFEAKKIENAIDELLKNAMSLHNMIFNVDEEEKKNIHQGYLSDLETVLPYVELTYELTYDELYKNKAIKPASSRNSFHILYQPKRKVRYIIMNFFSGFPLVQLGEIKHAWNNFIEFRTAKLFFAFLGTILTFLVGTFSIHHWTLFIMTIIHLLTRLMANRYRNQDDYVHCYRSIQLFAWPYMLLVLGNFLNYSITITGFPEDTFFIFWVWWLIWSELKGIVENAKVANLPIPPMLEEIINKSKDKNIGMPL